MSKISKCLGFWGDIWHFLNIQNGIFVQNLKMFENKLYFSKKVMQFESSIFKLHKTM